MSVVSDTQSADLLRFITCGSVDDGKSTLIGRLLWEAKQLYDDQLMALESDSRRHGTQGEGLDFALLVDGLAAEREQGITIDVAYRHFATPRRRFIVADTPGHVQYTRNMVTGASTAQMAILLVDVRHGVQEQTRRHACLVSLMGVRHVVLAVNKMDLIQHDPNRFNQVVEAFRTHAVGLHFQTVTTIPVSALHGDNIIHRSARMPWYTGPTLMAWLETLPLPVVTKHEGAVLPVQWVNRPHAAFRGYSGTLVRGVLDVGAAVRVVRTGQQAMVAEMTDFDGQVLSARGGDPITVCLDREIDASRGDVLVQADAPLDMTDQFEATLVWMHEEACLPGRNYLLKLGTQWTSASVTKLKHRLNVVDLQPVPANQLGLNDIATVQLATSVPVAFATFDQCAPMGRFILVDRFNHATVAAGLIQHNLRRAQNVHRQALTVDRSARERLNGHKGKVVWFTGLSGSGKSTLANALEMALHERGMRTYILDGDNVRQGLNKDLGFTDADRVENIRRVAEVAKLMMDAGLIVMTAFISPFRQEREMARELIGADHFIEVFVDTPLDVCENRDPKGLYAKARRGQIPNFTGVNSPYELPLEPAIVAGPSMGVDVFVSAIMRTIEES